MPPIETSFCYCLDSYSAFSGATGGELSEGNQFGVACTSTILATGVRFDIFVSALSIDSLNRIAESWANFVSRHVFKVFPFLSF